VIEFLALMAFVVAGFLVLRSTTAPVHERLAFIGFFLVEVVLLLATPAGSNAAVIARGVDASLADRIFRPDRAITSKHLASLAAVVVVALLVVARRRVLFE
jgi:hypothetical protein